MDTQLMQTGESLLISMCDNTVRTDSVSTDFRLLQTSLPVPTLWRGWTKQTNWDYDHGRHAYVIATAVSLIAAHENGHHCIVII